MKYNLKEKEMSNLVSRIADAMPDIVHKSKWAIEDIIYKNVKNKVNQEDRLLLACLIIKHCINMPMSISDHYVEILYRVECILRKGNEKDKTTKERMVKK